MVKSCLCAHSDVYMLVIGTITIEVDGDYDAAKQTDKENNSPKKFIFLKTFNSEFTYIEVWFTNQNSKPQR